MQEQNNPKPWLRIGLVFSSSVTIAIFIYSILAIPSYYLKGGIAMDAVILNNVITVIDIGLIELLILMVWLSFKGKKFAKWTSALLIILMLAYSGLIIHGSLSEKGSQLNEAGIISPNAPFSHVPETLMVVFKAGVNPEQAKQIAAKYGGKIVESVSYDESLKDGKVVSRNEIVSPWERWAPYTSNTTEIKFNGKNDEALNKLIETLGTDSNIENTTYDSITMPRDSFF
jgi:hypothetical protein